MPWMQIFNGRTTVRRFVDLKKTTAVVKQETAKEGSEQAGKGVQMPKSDPKVDKAKIRAALFDSL